MGHAICQSIFTHAVPKLETNSGARDSQADGVAEVGVMTIVIVVAEVLETVAKGIETVAKGFETVAIIIVFVREVNDNIAGVDAQIQGSVEGTRAPDS